MKNAFTLAEVLITLGVIGVVASMTMPTLINNHQEKTLITQNKVAYSTVLQALQRVQAEHEFFMDSVFTPGNSHLQTAKAFAKYFKGARCTGNAKPYNVKPMYPLEDPDTGKHFKQGMGVNRIELPNGVFLNVLQYDCQERVEQVVSYEQDGSVERDDDGNPVMIEHRYNICAQIQVDVNGMKKPNQTGRDVFAFDVTQNGWRFHNTVWYGNIQKIVSEGKFPDNVKDYDLNADFER